MKTAAVLAIAAVLTWGLIGASSLGASTWSTVLEHYEPIRQSLVLDRTDGVVDHARTIAVAVQALSEEFDAGSAGIAGEHADHLRSLLPKIHAAADKLAGVTELAGVRTAFSELTEPLLDYRKMVEPAIASKVAFCPMANKKWIQPDGDIGNPFFGQSMDKCGSFVEE